MYKHQLAEKIYDKLYKYLSPHYRIDAMRDLMRMTTPTLEAIYSCLEGDTNERNFVKCGTGLYKQKTKSG